MLKKAILAAYNNYPFLKEKTMKKLLALTAAVITSITIGCVDQNTLTKEEMERQSKADAIVAGVLFENEAEEYASYNVHKDGFVVISFDESVPSSKYPKIVDHLRSSKDISGVRAEQAGVEVCPIKF